MGQKSHPIALRLQKTNRRFESLWYTKTNYHGLLTQQLQIQLYLQALFQNLSLSPGSLSLILSAKKSQILISYFDTRGSRQEKGLLSPSKSGGLFSSRRLSPILFQTLRVHKKRGNAIHTVPDYSVSSQNPFFFSHSFPNRVHPPTPTGLGEQRERVNTNQRSLLFSESRLWPIAASQKGQKMGSLETLFLQKQRLLRLFLFFAFFQKWEPKDSLSRVMNKVSIYTFFQESRISSFFQEKSSQGLSLEPLKTPNAPTSLSFLETLFQSALSRPFWLESWQASSESQSALFLAAEIAFFLEKRISFRRVKNLVLRDIEENKDGRWSHVNGIRVVCSGRVGGSSGKKAQRARKDGFQWGETSLHVFSSKVDYSQKTALTGFGQVGVKVWICYT